MLWKIKGIDLVAWEVCRDTMIQCKVEKMGVRDMWIAYALGAACFFGLRGILYHWTAQQAMNRNLMLFGTFVTGSIVTFTASLAAGHRWTPEILAGLAMGVFSFAANACMYKGFAVGKASLVAILSSLPPVVVALLAYAAWGEALALWQAAAFGIIIVGILLIRYSNDISLKRLQGAQWGLLAMLFFALNDLSSKQSTLLGADTFPTLFFMFATGSFLFGGWWLLDRKKNKAHASAEMAAAAEKLPWSERRTFLWGMLVGTTNAGGMMAMMAAFTTGVTGLVSAVASTNVLLVLLYTRLATKEKFTGLELTGIASLLTGVAVLRMFQE